MNTVETLLVTDEQLLDVFLGKLVEHGWERLTNQTAIASKQYQTAAGIKQALVYFTKSDGYHRRISGDYQSQGRNILSTASALIPSGSDTESIIAYAEQFAIEVESRINESYAMRLARSENAGVASGFKPKLI